MSAEPVEDGEVLQQADSVVVRVGNTVRRPSAGAAAHALLVHLEQIGFP